MNLFDLISRRNPKVPIFLNDEGQITLPQLVEAKNIYSGFLSAVAGKSVALCLQSAQQLAYCILLLDGVASQIVLMPNEVSSDARLLMLGNSMTQVVVSDYLTQKECPVQLITFSKSAGHFQSYTVDSRWMLPTSGTTGVPKLISHTMSSLVRTVKQENDKGRSLCWGALYDISRFAGIQVYLQALLGGSTLALRNNATPLPELLSWYAKIHVNALSATPSMWQKILMTPESKELRLEQITLGGEIVRQGILNALAARFQGTRISHIYASTEFGVGFSVADGKEGFPAKWLYGEQPIAKINTQNGELQLRREGAWFATGDAVVEHMDRILFCGRLNGSINVGGNKVMPEEVEIVLLRYPGVLLASVSAQKSSIMGNLVHAEVVAHIDEGTSQEFRNRLMEHCRQSLEPFKVPAVIKIVDDVSLSSSGKMVRNGGLA